MTSTETDSFLLSRVRAKDRKALLEWMDVRKVSFYKLARVYLKNDYEIEEVFYQTIEKAIERIQQLKNDQYFETVDYWFVY